MAKTTVKNGSAGRVATQKVIDRHKSAGLRFAKQGTQKAAATAMTWWRRSLRGDVSGRPRHYITGNLWRSVNWQNAGSKERPAAIVGSGGLAKYYARKIEALDSPGAGVFGIEKAIEAFDNFIKNLKLREV